MNFRQKGVLSVLLVFSLAFNFAFIAVSLFHMQFPRPSVLKETPNDEAKPQRRRRPERLQLTDEQRKELDVRKKQLAERLEEKQKEASELRGRLIQLLEDPDSDAEEIESVGEQFHQIQHQMRIMIFKDMLQLRQILDSEQRRRLGRGLIWRHAPEPGDGEKTQPHSWLKHRHRTCG